jgi:hypothetical protein
MLQDTERRAGNLMVSICLITAVWGGAASRWIINGAVVPWDSKNQFYAFFRFLSASLHATDWPFWNPYHYGGHPSVADPQSLVFAPLFVAWGALDPAPSMRAFDIVILAHLLVGGIAIVVIGCRAPLAGAELRVGGDTFYVRRRGFRSPPAYRYHSQLQPIPIGAAAAATRP